MSEPVEPALTPQEFNASALEAADRIAALLRPKGGEDGRS